MTRPCPHCKSADVVPLAGRYCLRCRSCRRQFSPDIGTAMYRRKVNPEKAKQMLMLAESGLSHTDIARIVGVQYVSAANFVRRHRAANSRKGEA